MRFPEQESYRVFVPISKKLNVLQYVKCSIVCTSLLLCLFSDNTEVGSHSRVDYTYVSTKAKHTNQYFLKEGESFGSKILQ